MTDCIFCKIADGEAKSWKVYEDQDVCAFFDYNPASVYHTLVISKKYYINFLNTPSDKLLYYLFLHLLSCLILYSL